MLTAKWYFVLLLCPCIVEAIFTKRKYKQKHSSDEKYILVTPRPDESKKVECVPIRAEKAEPTLVLAHVVFRHGNRTSQDHEVYPNDPYGNYTYFPVGRGQLTNAGKLKEYNLGRTLRMRYNNFLGEYYYPGIIEAETTNYDRTKMSLQLVLAGLFPPKKDAVWNSNLEWQPIPYNTGSNFRNPVLSGINCPNFIEKLKQAQVDWQTEFDKHKDLFNYLSLHTGGNVTTFADVYRLFFVLYTQKTWGFQLPSWTKSIWPNPILDLAPKNYLVKTSTPDLLKLSAGYHLKKIIQDTRTEVLNLTDTVRPKMFLYSGHENNVAHMLIMLKIFDPPHIPPYGSYLILELHNINNVYGFKVFYQRYLSSDPEQIAIPLCGNFCPLEKFVELYKEYLPLNENLCFQS